MLDPTFRSPVDDWTNICMTESASATFYDSLRCVHVAPMAMRTCQAPLIAADLLIGRAELLGHNDRE